jgi:shikimate kinase
VTGTADPTAGGGDAGGHVVLLGSMGVGKTTLARALGERLGRPVRDNDADLESRTGRTGADIAATEGVEVLHDLEAGLLLDALVAGPPRVIAAAASVVDAEACRTALAGRATTVWLDAPAEALARRRTGGTHRRHVTPGAARALDDRRRARLAAIADLRLDARLPTPEQVEHVLTHLPDPAPP